MWIRTSSSMGRSAASRKARSRVASTRSGRSGRRRKTRYGTSTGSSHSSSSTPVIGWYLPARIPARQEQRRGVGGRTASILDLRDGRIVRIQGYMDRRGSQSRRFAGADSHRNNRSPGLHGKDTGAGRALPDSGDMEAMDRLMDRFWPLGWCVAAGALVAAGHAHLLVPIFVPGAPARSAGGERRTQLAERLRQSRARRPAPVRARPGCRSARRCPRERPLPSRPRADCCWRPDARRRPRAVPRDRRGPSRAGC